MKGRKEVEKLIDHIREELKIAEDLAAKIEPNLPAGWKADYIVGGWRGLLFSQLDSEAKSENALNDFKLVCSYVKQATGADVKRAPWIVSDFLFCLEGVADYEYQSRKFLQIRIRQHDVKTCPLVFEEKMVREARLAEPCLGEMGFGR